MPRAAPLVLLGTGTLHADPAHLARLAVVAVLCVAVPRMLMRDAVLRCLCASAAESPTPSP